MCNNQYPSVAVIIPVHNRKKETLNIIGQLLRQKYKKIKIVIVNDGSTDGTSTEISNQYTDVAVLNGDGKLWWAGSINKGISWALSNNYDYVLTLNDDQTISSDFLSELIKYTEIYSDSILGSIIYLLGEENIIFSAGIKYGNNLRQQKIVGHMKRNVNQFILPFEVDVLPGWSVLIPSKILRQIGLYDNKRWPQVYMEGEFCLRAKQHGYKIITVPTSKVWNDRVDKIQIPYWNKIGMRKLYWLLKSKKSHLEIIQYYHYQSFLYGGWLQLFTRGIGSIMFYWIKVLGYGFTTGDLRTKLKLIKYNKS